MRCRKPLNAITHACETGQGNLLALAVDATRKRATLGEISYRLRKCFRKIQSCDTFNFGSLFIRI